MAKQLSNVNMPTRDDVLQISEDLQSLDRRIARIETSLQKLTQSKDQHAAKPKAKTPRTKKAPGSKGGK